MDNGRFLALADLLIEFRRDFRSGTGRLHAMWKAIKYVNIRASGLADTADIRLLTDWLNNFDDNTVLAAMKKERGKAASIFALANFIAEYLLVDGLIIGRRRKKDLDWQDPDKVEALALEMQKGLVCAFAAFTDLPEEDIDNFVTHCGFSWERLAIQMSFWMRNDAKGYPQHVMAKKLPDIIYDSKSRIHIDKTSKMRGWSNEKGFNLSNGKADSGTVNGPHMIQESVIEWYLAALFMLLFHKE